jgi:hypothetical protein
MLLRVERGDCDLVEIAETHRLRRR